MKSKLVTPHAAALIWNYNDRVDSQGAIAATHETLDQVVIGTSSIISITTSKQKSSPAGQFEIRLAPRFNWVTRITPGSWCAILMSQDKLPDMEKNRVGTASEKSFKMLGRIDSVRGAVEVDQSSGARQTVFIVSGRDWGSVFESLLYIDPILANNQVKADPVSQAYSILGLNLFLSYNKDKTLPSSSDLVDTMVKLWGGGATGSAASIAKANTGAVTLSKPFITTQTQFRLPKEVASFMRQGESGASLGSNLSFDKPIPGSTAYNFADLIKTYHGKLKKEDKGTSDAYTRLSESYGLPNVHNFFGQNTFWQLITELSNQALNENITDIRWENGSPKFALYHRIRPFVNDSNFLTKLAATSFSTEPSTLAAKTIVEQNMSLFKYVKKNSIDIGDVVSINFGTNWRDKINFIEVQPTPQLLTDTEIFSKLEGQTYDPIGYERDGFKPLIVASAFLPYAEGVTPQIKDFTYWKYLIREWHFNNHMLLNGSVTFVGQNQYIQVGDNIIIDSKILGDAPMNLGQKYSPQAQTFILAHVENISHTFSVNQETGGRSFFTTVQFVRGVITNKDGTPLNLIDGNAIDKYALTPKGLSEKDVRNTNTFGTSVSSDPDKQKLGKDGLM
jgi:hypothetical protein